MVILDQLQCRALRVTSVLEKFLAMDHILAYGVAVILGLVLMYGMLVSVWRRKLPPGPFPWPVVGNLFLGGDYPHQKFAQLAKEQYGNIMSLFFGSVRVVIVSDAKMAKELLSVSDAKFASRPIRDLMYTASKYINYGNMNVSMAFSEYSPRVRDKRRLCINELFSAQKIEMKKSTRAEEIRRTVAKLKELAGHPSVEIRSVVSEMSLRMSCRTVFNKAFMHSEHFSSTEGILHPLTFRRVEIEHTKLLATHNIADVIPVFRLLFGKFDVQGIDARWKKLGMLEEKCSNSILEWYREHAPNGSVPAKESTTDFVETMLRLTDSGQYTTSEIGSLIWELLTAGADTLAAVLEWSLLELVRHPLVMERLHAEIDAKFGMLRPVEEDEAAQLPYLQAVVKEVLRLHVPVTLSIPHSNMEDATLAGYHIPARTTVFANLWAIHRDTTTWGNDALVFNPDRFLNSDYNVNGPNNWQYIPFGAGRRICPGRTLAMKEFVAALGSFIHAFEWSALPGVELTAEEGTDGLNIRPRTPLLLRINLRPSFALYSA